MLPLAIAIPYLVLTLLLFFFGPYVWPVNAWWVVYFYVPAAFVLLALGFRFSANMPARESNPLSITLFYVVGGVGTLVLLLPTAVIYTGSYPWEIATALSDQREAYSALGQQLELTEGSRGPLALIRALVAPFAFCVLPFAVLYWTRLKMVYRVLAVFVVLASIDLSILRGTTRELADLIIVGASAYLVFLARSSISSGKNLGSSLRKRWKALLIVPLIGVMVVVTLVGRTEARLGGTDSVCLGESTVCLTTSEAYSSLPESTYFGIATVTGYFSQGYYGLSLAGERSFESTLGLGHSSAVSALYVVFGGDPYFLERSYTARLEAEGWSDSNRWSTMLAWIANDVGFTGGLIFVLLMGLAWGRAWINATQGMDDRSAVFFCAIMMMVFYLPANNQMMLTFDAYATLLFWGLASAFGGAKARQGSPVG